VRCSTPDTSIGSTWGPIPTTRLNWFQPHEGNIVDFLYRARAFQMA
jgi:hypothetical protein